MVLICTIHPINNIYVRIYMQYIPWITKTNTRLHHGIQYNKMECRRFGLSFFFFFFWGGGGVDMLVCRRFGLSTFWFVDVLVCRRFGLSMFWFVDVLGLSTFRFVDVLVCQRFGCRRFDLATFWPVTFRATQDNCHDLWIIIQNDSTITMGWTNDSLWHLNEEWISDR